MTQAQEPTQPEKAAAHSRWKYTGAALGTLFIEGRPLVTVTAEGEIVEAPDQETAEAFEKTGLFKLAPADAPASAPVSDEPVQVVVPAEVYPSTVAEAEAEAETTPQERE